VNDTIAPVLDPAPANLTVQCITDVPAMTDLNWTDNCAGNGSVTGTDVSNGATCPEIITRTWTITDDCGNTTTVAQIITVNDTIAPVLDPAPANLTVQCASDVPAMTDLNWTDNCAGNGSVTGTDVSNGATCPEIITRTWNITDDCGNTTSVSQTITVNDTIAPVFNAVPADLTVQCSALVPPLNSLYWTDNCSGSGSVMGTEVSNGMNCPEVLTRTWTVMDDCGNTTIETQVITIHDTVAPTAAPLPTLHLSELPSPDISILTNVSDNSCGGVYIQWVQDNSDRGSCPETVTRTYSLTDGCGNVTLLTQEIIIGDYLPNVSFTADPTILDNLSDGIVDFENYTSGAETYSWNFGDNSPLSTETNPTHQFDVNNETTYDIWLVATSELGCSDSAYISIDVTEELVYYIPNAFTPDGNQFNQTFKPIFSSGFDVNNYNLSIFNRWGELVFESNDHNFGWDGTYHGKVAKSDVYVYKVAFGLKYTDEQKVVTGNVTLLK
jgi:gliding motility-associated-like protein